MTRRTKLWERIHDNLEFAGIDQHLGDVASESYRRGLVAAYATVVCDMAEPGEPEWLDANRIARSQSDRINEMRRLQPAQVS